MKSYYFPINSLSLSHYWGCACIKAAKYFTNKPQDIQDKYNDVLLLTTSRRGTMGSDCCLELVLDKKEEDDLQAIGNGWYIYDKKPLPITRVKKILFSDKKQMEHSIGIIRLNTAFVPDKLIDLSEFENNSLDDIVNYESKVQLYDQTAKIKQFDRFLGALALMRLSHNPQMNYSANYIATLSFFNKEIERQLNCSGGNYNLSLQGIFDESNASKELKEILPYLKEHVDEVALNKYAEIKDVRIEKDPITKFIKNIDGLKGWTYNMAYLCYYGIGDEKRKNIDELIIQNFQNLKEDKSEGVALFYGYNQGYAVFTKSYQNVDFKYKFESQLDYYTIESVYQYVFNGRVSETFPYLDGWCSRLPERRPRPSKGEYKILDEIIVGKKKAQVFSSEWWSKFNLSSIFGELFLPYKNIFDKHFAPVIRRDLEEEIGGKYEDELEKLRKQEFDFEQKLKEVLEQFDAQKQSLAEKENDLAEKDREISRLREMVDSKDNTLVVSPKRGEESAEEKIGNNFDIKPNLQFETGVSAPQKNDVQTNALLDKVLEHKDVSLRVLKKMANGIKDDNTLGQLLEKLLNEQQTMDLGGKN